MDEFGETAPDQADLIPIEEPREALALTRLRGASSDPLKRTKPGLESLPFGSSVIFVANRANQRPPALPGCHIYPLKASYSRSDKDFRRSRL